MTPTWCRYEVGVARSTMPANVEVKARLADRDKAVAVAKELSGNEGMREVSLYSASMTVL